MAGRAHLIQNHPGNVRPRLEILQPFDQRRNAPGKPPGIQHQHHPGPQQPGQGRCAVAAVGRDAIVQTLVALYHNDLAPPAIVPEISQQLRGARGVEIQVVAWPLGCLAKPQRVDVVRAFFEALHGEAPVP